MATELWDEVEHRFADSDGVKIHYAALGQGRPLVVMIHGFPDFLPHPAGLAREIANNPQQKKNSEYAFNFQKPEAHKLLSTERLTQWVKDPQAREKYEDTLKRSDLEAMLNYYKTNYPQADAPPPTGPATFPKMKAPVLIMHGLDDQALLPGALNGTWEWVEKDLTIVTVPGASHFVQQDAAQFVADAMVDWLARRRK